VEGARKWNRGRGEQEKAAKGCQEGTCKQRTEKECGEGKGKGVEAGG
jgi:hypothetical protein